MIGISLCIIFCISYPENSDSRTKDSVSRISHFECFNIVRLIEHEIRKVEGPFRYRVPPVPAQPANGNSADSNSTSAQQSQTGQTEKKKADLSTIIQDLSKNCDRLVDTRRAVCKDVLREDNVKKVYDFIKEGKRPDFICSSIGYKRVAPSRSRMINRKVCTQVVDLIKIDFNRSVTPLFGHRRFGFPGSNAAANANASAGTTSTNTTTSQAKLLVDTVTNSSDKQKISSTSNSSLPHANSTTPMKGMFSHMNRFTSFFTRKGPRVCKQFADTPNYQQCLILSRIAIRAARPQIKAGNSSESICEFLENAKLIQLTDKDVGTIAQENDMEQIRRNQRRSGYFPRRDDDENAPIRRNHNRFDDENSSARRRHNKPDDENAPLRRNDKNNDRDSNSNQDRQSRPRIENNNNN